MQQQEKADEKQPEVAPESSEMDQTDSTSQRMLMSIHVIVNPPFLVLVYLHLTFIYVLVPACGYLST